MYTGSSKNALELTCSALDDIIVVPNDATTVFVDNVAAVEVPVVVCTLGVDVIDTVTDDVDDVLVVIVSVDLVVGVVTLLILRVDAAFVDAVVVFSDVTVNIWAVFAETATVLFDLCTPLPPPPPQPPPTPH